jgi:hypothetical protein
MPDGVEAAEAELTELAAAWHALTARLVSAVGRFEPTDAWAGPGIVTFAQWASINLGWSRRTSRGLSGTARGLARLPEVARGLAEGRLSADQARVLAEVATPDREAFWVELAAHASATQLERIAAAYRRAERGDDDSEDGARDRRLRRGVRIDPAGGGLERLVAVLEPDEMAVVRAALDAESERSWRSGPSGHDTASPEPHSARLADALVQVADGALAAEPTPVVGGERTQVVVHVDADYLSGASPSGRCHVADGLTVGRRTVLRHLCDCHLQPLVERNHRPIDVGRSRRVVSRRLRRALEARDKGCQFPGCGCTRFLDAHHVVHWLGGGHTSLDNLVLLCRRHHRLHHEGRFRITRDAAGWLHFFDHSGYELGPAIRPPVHLPSPIATPAGRPGALDGGAPFDLADTISLLVDYRPDST